MGICGVVLASEEETGRDTQTLATIVSIAAAVATFAVYAVSTATAIGESHRAPSPSAERQLLGVAVGDTVAPTTSSALQALYAGPLLRRFS